jgi:hypothetical protein
MREATFLSKNEKKWRKVESILDKNSRLRPNESADMFVDLTDDLSYAKTHFPKSITTRYLNSLVGGIFQRISYRRKEKFERIGEFWKYEVPLTVRKHHRVMLFVFVFFPAHRFDRRNFHTLRRIFSKGSTRRWLCRNDA